MIDPADYTTAELATALLIHYSFDLGGYSTSEIIHRWIDNYPDRWVRLALIEALYRGRYKAVSVDQILTVWQRREEALYHFNREFERLICANLPQKLEQTDTHKINSISLLDGDKEEYSLPSSSVKEPDSQNNCSTTEKNLDLRGANHQGIRQFTPDQTATELHTKLKAISQSDRPTRAESKGKRSAQNSED